MGEARHCLLYSKGTWRVIKIFREVASCKCIGKVLGTKPHCRMGIQFGLLSSPVDMTIVYTTRRALPTCTLRRCLNPKWKKRSKRTAKFVIFFIYRGLLNRDPHLPRFWRLHAPHWTFPFDAMGARLYDRLALATRESSLSRASAEPQRQWVHLPT